MKFRVDGIMITLSSPSPMGGISGSGIWDDFRSNLVWTYSGAGTFIGLSRTQGATTPDSDLEVEDMFMLNELSNAVLYSVATGSGSSITDLTGTKWIINDYLSGLALSNMNYKINFTSNSTNFDFISFGGSSINYRQTSTGNFVQVYSTVGSGGSND